MLEVFKIAATLDVSGNGLDFMKSFALGITGAHGQLEALEKKLGMTSATMKQAFIGFGEVFAGVELLKGIDKLANAGKELNHQQSMLMRNGVTYRDVMKETALVYSDMLKQVPTASAVDFIRTLNELKSVKGNISEAREALVASMKIEGLISNSTGRSAEGEGYNFWRAIEDKGIIQSKAKTDAMLNAMVQGTIATGGKIGGNDWFTYGRRAGTAWMGDDIASLPLQLMEMQTLSPTTAGTSRRTFANMIEGSQKLTKAQKGAWSEIGMLGPDGIKDHTLEQTRPDLFIQEVMDSLKARGITTEDQVKGWASHALNRGAGNYFMTAFAGMNERDPESGLTRLEKERRNLGEAQGLNKAYDTMMGTDYGANMKALEEQWKSLMEALGGPATRAAIPVLKDLTAAVTGMANFADKHQQITQIGLDIAAVSSGLLILGGTLNLLKVGLRAVNPFSGGRPDRSDAKAGTIDDLTRGAEALGPKPSTVPVERAGGVVAAIESGFAKAATDLGTFGLMALWASKSDVGVSKDRMDRMLKNFSFMPAHPQSRDHFFHMNRQTEMDILGIPDWQREQLGPPMPPRSNDMPFNMRPADAGDRMKDRVKVIDDEIQRIKDSVWQFGALDAATQRLTGAFGALAGSLGGLGGAASAGGVMNASYTQWDSPGSGSAGGGGRRWGGGSGGGPNPYAGAGGGGGDFVAPVGDHLTAGMRQNNMGNLGWFRGMHAGNGLLGPSNARDVDHSIARYATQDDGIRAAAALAFRKYTSGMHDTWDLIAGPRGWTPGALGPGASVNVARAMGLGNRDDLHLDNPDQMVKFLHGLAIQEHGAAGRYYSDEKIRAALGTLRPPRPAPAFAAPPPPPAPSRAPGAITAQNVPPIEIHLHSYMDTKKVAHAVTKVQVAENRHHRSVGGMDGYGSHLPPGGDVADSA